MRRAFLAGAVGLLVAPRARAQGRIDLATAAFQPMLTGRGGPVAWSVTVNLKL